jgi:hypothetical protein
MPCQVIVSASREMSWNRPTAECLCLYACLAFHWLRVHILAHKPDALTAIYFLSVCGMYQDGTCNQATTTSSHSHSNLFANYVLHRFTLKHVYY